MSYLSEEELVKIGFESFGNNVFISRYCRIYNPGKIKVGSNVRIDDFTVISAGSGGICIGNNIHIAVFSSLIGKGSIVLEDFSNISSRVSIYSSNDDYSGEYLTNPTIPEEYTNVSSEMVLIKKHTIIGSGSVVLPGVTLHQGVAVGALSLVNKDCESWAIYAGQPVKKIKDRSRGLLDKEAKFVSGK